MGPADWFRVVVYAAVGSTMGLFLFPLASLARRDRWWRPWLIVWATQVALVWSVCVATLVTDAGRWYAYGVAVMVLGLGLGLVWVRRRQERQALRELERVEAALDDEQPAKE